MKLALNQARISLGNTKHNPSVGCVIVKNNNVIRAGFTSFNGRPHAEHNALNTNNDDIKNSSLYVTLEPCAHYGKTPPCINALVKSKVKKVIYSIDDRDPRTFKKAKKILKLNKILTKSGLLINETKNLYKSYNYIKKNKFPYITGKLACSSNLHILNNSTHITNEHSRKVSHLLRFKNQGILTTYKTVNSDNPKLTCRIDGLEKFSPVKIIIDKNLKIKLNSYIVNNNQIVDCVTKAINGGVNMIQMREKHLDFKEQLNLAQKLRAITLNKALLIINNNIDIAMSVKADGIQTGKNGEKIKYIRSQIDSQMLIGYSSHSLDESIQATKEGANYLIAGPVFKTASHPELRGKNTQFLCKIKILLLVL